MFFTSQQIKKFYKKHQFFAYLIAIAVYAMLAKQTFATEFYEIETPYRKTLNSNYQYNIDVDEETSNKEIDYNKIDRVFLDKNKQLYAEEKETKKAVATETNEKTSSKRQQFLQNGETSQTPNTNIAKKQEEKKSWIQDWFPKTSVKPFELIGAYISFKLWLAWTTSSNVSASETTSIHDTSATKDLFTGKAKFNILPAFSIAVGNDRFKWWRWEIELGYNPTLSSGISNLTSSEEMSAYSFDISKKDISFHLLHLSMNNYLQYAFFDKTIVGYIGLGLGVGYAWSMSSTLSSDFVMPMVKGTIGFSFMLTNKAKLNISYNLIYTNINIPSNYAFARVRNSNGSKTASNYAIQGGSLKFKNVIINAITFEYQFYTA